MLSGVALDDGGGVQASMGVAWGDVDNDGRLDLFVPCLRAETFPLYRNEGDGFFTDIARRTGIAAATLPYPGFGAILADFHNDGCLYPTDSTSNMWFFRTVERLTRLAQRRRDHGGLQGRSLDSVCSLHRQVRRGDVQTRVLTMDRSREHV